MLYRIIAEKGSDSPANVSGIPLMDGHNR